MKKGNLRSFTYSPGYCDMLGEYHSATLRKDKSGEWEEYTLGAEDITIKPVYTLAGETKVTADCENEITLDYKESKAYNFNVEYLPDGATAHVFYNGEDRGEGTSIEVKEPTDDYIVECKVLDKDGKEIASSGEIKVKVKNSFFDRHFIV